MEKIIIDADPGVDDIFLILVACKSNKFEIQGISTVSGNCSLVDGTRNTLNILEMIQREDVLVYAGSEDSLRSSMDLNAEEIHGNNGMGGIKLHPPIIKKQKKDAVDFLIETVNENPGEITILSTGPLTNIAKAIQKNSTFADNINKLVVMSGADELGNITPYAEFNCFKDPEAAKIVYESAIQDIIVFGLNVTNKNVMSPDDENKLKNMKNKLATFLYKITRIGAKFDREHFGVDGFLMHDILVLAYMIDKTISDFREVKIDVVLEGERRGETIIREQENSNIRFAKTIDASRVKNMLYKYLFDGENR